MNDMQALIDQHNEVTRRYFVRLGVAGIAASTFACGANTTEGRSVELEARIKELAFLTRPEDFGTVERGKPLPYTLPPDALSKAGLVKESWRLEVVPDPDSDAKLENPLSKELGTALDWNGLQKLAETRAVRYMKVMTCNNRAEPLGMGLWEGVPLRDVIWMARPTENVRRIFYQGYHNDDPEQLFQSSLPIGRVLADPPGEHPVMLCYKLNGDWISGKRGGPVRLLVPDTYGFKSIKWLTRITLTNLYHANDTYALKNNDIDSKMKTAARFIHAPTQVKAGEPLPITGIAQSGMSGLSKVQYCVKPQDQEWPEDDPYFTTADWTDAEVLPPPENWGGGLPDGKLPPIPRQFDEVTGKPLEWPIRNGIAHWAALLPALAPGKYILRCRSIDTAGFAQPMPRPFRKSGRNAIQEVPITVSA